MSKNNISGRLDQITRTKILGVDYHHMSLPGADDLYLTEYGLPFIENLLPRNFWTDEDWFKKHSQKLKGTSTLYKITTKEVNRKSKDIVIKWNRMGQDIPGSLDVKELNIEFNSPFEEFALVTELRNMRHESAGYILTHKPLAIYVPPAHIDLDRLGRKVYKMEALISSHDDVKLHMFRNYAVIYEWIKGIDAVEAFEQGILKEQDVTQLTLRSDNEVRKKGFVLGDPKPHHVIVRPNRYGELARDRNGNFLYALVDFELLKRTQKHEEEIRTAKRKAYLYKQAHRFEDKDLSTFPSNLKPVTIFGVDYVFGSIEGTGGALWIVGKDPTLFDYFLPEKWRDTHRIRQSVFDQIYRTTTKDDVHLVWKISRVGELPDMDPIKKEENRILQHGYNSPFEEVALALELTAKGIPTTYPRAIYMAASKSDMDESLRDDSRYNSHKSLLTPDGKPVLRMNNDYIIFWGYWNGPDELLAEKDESPYQGVDALLSYRRGLLNKNMYQQLLHKMKKKLAAAGIEDLNLRGNHILLAVDNSGQLVKDSQGMLEIRICNFELLKRTKV